ncbi:MAG: xanthine dehydrogenase family protein subunit M [Hadesarchaea archaeon]|nr:xanthine dehydrogenase family protein subunit M [Hadesarchaea archaeon]
MALPEFDYLKPESLSELKEALSEHGENAKILAGGTDLMPDLRARIIDPKLIIDIKEIEEMNELSFNEKDGLTIGASVALKELVESDILKEKFGPLWSAVNQLADPVIRNRATLAGNICTSSPAGDSPPALIVLNAEVIADGENGERIIPIQDFFTGVKSNSLNENEFVKAIRIPTPPESAEGDYLKWKRTKGEDLSVVGVAALMTNEENGVLRIALSSVAPIPLYIQEAEDILKKNKSLDEKISEAVNVVKENISPITDVRCCESYRLHMAGVLTKKALNKLLKEEN